MTTSHAVPATPSPVSSVAASSVAASPVANANRHLDASLNLQRKAALVAGGAVDHAGKVRIAANPHFDLSRTIFGKLDGIPQRLIIKDKLGKEPFWSDAAVAKIEADYAEAQEREATPVVDPALIDFMEKECDFSMEHADGTFLEHLVFCHDYAARHFAGHSPKVALLHSILGTGTNNFPMEIGKLPKLRELLTESETLQIEAFPSFVRLFYNQELLAELEENLHRLGDLEAIHFHRVIDNEPRMLDAEGFWIQLNYQLMHFVDFMPPANWGMRRSDPLLAQFQQLSTFLDRAGQRRAKVEVAFPKGPSLPIGERPTVVGIAAELIPASVTMKIAQKTMRDYSGRIGHSLDYRLEWR